MAKKSTRKIPSMVVTVNGGGQADIDALCNNETFSRAVYKETIAGITDAINNKYQLDDSNIILNKQNLDSSFPQPIVSDPSKYSNLILY
jgi:hypothetical protein